MSLHDTQRTVVITGAGGFVMRAVIEVLRGANMRIVAIDRAFSAHVRDAWHGSGIHLIEADATDFSADIEGVDTLILGAAVTASPEEVDLSPEDHYRANINPVLSGLEWAQQHGIRRVIGISSSAVYASTEGEVFETDPCTPEGLYAVAKASLEGLFTTLNAEYGRDCAVIRLSNIYGEGEVSSATRPRKSIIGQLVEQAVTSGQIQPIDEPARDWTLASDIGRALMPLIEQEKLPHVVYNLASGQRTTTLEIAHLIQHIRPDVTIAEPKQSLRPLTRRGWLSSQRLQADTGFNSWTPLLEGLRRAVVVDQKYKMERVP